MTLLKTPWSVRRIVRKEEADWRSYNEVRKRYRLSWFRRDLLFAGENPLRFCASLLLLLLVTLALGNVLPADLLTPKWSDWGASEQLSYFSTLLTVQATLAALVYPIVIAFVTLFLQRRPGAEAFVNLYILDSGALVAGLSSLTLVIAMGGQYLLLPLYGAASLPAWVALDSIWFLLNVTLTAHFLYRTIEFLRPDQQMESVKRYVTSVALPREVSRIYAFQVLANAQHKGWLPAKHYLDDSAPDEPKILISTYFPGESPPQAKLTFLRPHILYDIRLWPLRLLVASWVRSAKALGLASQVPLTKKSHAPLLTIPLTPGSIYDGTLTLARVNAGPDLEPWQRFLLRKSLVFRRHKRAHYGIRLKSILAELESDARDAASGGDNEAFIRTYRAFVDIHALLLGASLVKSEDGSLTSWGVFPDPESFFDRRLHQSWHTAYRSIFEAAVESMSRDVRPIKRLCHLTQQLSGTDLRKSPLEIRQDVLRLPPMMMYLIASWWSKRLGEQGVLEHDHMRPAMLKPPLRQTYREVMGSFIAGWEHARSEAVRWLDSSAEFDWSAIPSMELSVTHISETARMLLGAVRHGDREAAEWLADTLSKWSSPFRHEHAPASIYRKTVFLTIDDLNAEWTQVFDSLAISAQELQWERPELSKLQRSVVLAALQNFVVDIRLLTVELLLSFVLGGDDVVHEESMALEIAIGLLTGQQWRSGGTPSQAFKQMSAADYLDAKIRQVSNRNTSSQYRVRLDQFVERIRDTQREEMISSRTYMWSGVRDMESLHESQLALLAALSKTAWTPSDILKRTIDQWSLQGAQTIDHLKYQVQRWLANFDADKPAPALVSTLLARMDMRHDSDSGWRRAKDGIESLGGYLDDQRTQALSAEPVDPARLTQIAEYASGKAFASQPTQFPLTLFAEVLHVPQEFTDFTIKMKVGKDEVVRDEMAQRAGGDEDFWADLVAEEVGALVLADVLRACEVKDIPVDQAEAYWLALSTEAKALEADGRTPILILCNQTQPDWVWDWQYSMSLDRHPRPNDLRVHRLESEDPAYVCHFNEIPVYTGPLPMGESILIAKEAFDQVKFREFSASRFVDISYAPVEDNALSIDLALRYSRHVQAGVREATRLLHAAQRDS